MKNKVLEEVTLAKFFKRDAKIKVMPVQGVAAALQGMHVQLHAVTFLEKDEGGILIDTQQGVQYHPWTAIGYVEEWREGIDDQPKAPPPRLFIPQGQPRTPQ